MKRNTALATAVAAALSGGTAFVATAAIAGASWFGFGDAGVAQLDTGSTTTVVANTADSTEVEHEVEHVTTTLATANDDDHDDDRATSTTTSTTSTTTRPAAPSAVAPQQLTFSAEGGTIVVEVSADGLHLVSATPSAGFTAKVEAEGDELEVEFESSTHRSKIEVELEHGTVTHSIREEDRSSSSTSGSGSSHDDDDDHHGGHGSDD